MTMLPYQRCVHNWKLIDSGKSGKERFYQTLKCVKCGLLSDCIFDMEKKEAQRTFKTEEQ